MKPPTIELAELLRSRVDLERKLRPLKERLSELNRDIELIRNEEVSGKRMRADARNDGLVNRVMSGENIPDIAKEFGISVSTVRAITCKACKARNWKSYCSGMNPARCSPPPVSYLIQHKADFGF